MIFEIYDPADFYYGELMGGKNTVRWKSSVLRPSEIFVGLPEEGKEEEKEQVPAPVLDGSLLQQDPSTAVYSHFPHCQQLMRASKNVFGPEYPSASPCTQILLLISMLYKTLFITEEEKTYLKNLVFQNDAGVYAILQRFESSHTLYAIQEDVRLLLEGREDHETLGNEEELSFWKEQKQVYFRYREDVTRVRWQSHADSVLYRSLQDAPLPLSCEKIAAFALEGGLVTTRSGCSIPMSPDDWKWRFPQIPQRLLALHNQGFTILFFSNQSHIQRKRSTEAITCMSRLEAMASHLGGIPFLSAVGIRNDYYQLPQTGMWDLLVQEMDRKESQSFYVGPRAGRNGDASSVDRKFAHNVQVSFYTPEEFFLDERPATYQLDTLNRLLSLPWDHDAEKQCYSSLEEIVSSTSQRLFLLVGPPASGKSWISRKLADHRSDCVHVELFPTLPPADYDLTERVDSVEKYLQEGKSVIVDGGFPSFLERQGFVSLAKSMKILCHCIVSYVSIELAHHMSAFRNKLSDGCIPRVSEEAFAVYERQYQQPSLVEGFREISYLPLELGIQSSEEERLFHQYY